MSKKNEESDIIILKIYKEEARNITGALYQVLRLSSGIKQNHFKALYALKGNLLRELNKK